MILQRAARASVVLGAVLGALVGGALPTQPAQAAQTPSAAVTTGLPTADTVGVPAGTSLTAMASGVVETGGTTITNRVITGDVRFTGSNLTLRNVRITGHAVFRGDNIVLEDSEVGALSLSGTMGATVSRVDVTGSAGNDGIHITSGSGPAGRIAIRDTWVHNPLVTATSHYDGIQVRGVDGLVLERVAVDLGAHKPQYNAALFLEDMGAANRNITVASSRFTGGGYEMYSYALNVAVRNTTFSGGRWGHLYPSSPTFTITEFANNTDGAGNHLKLAGSAFVVGACTTGRLAPTLAGWFRDVPLTSQFAADIAWLMTSGVTEGYPDGTFRPASSVTREAMAAFLYRAAGSPSFSPPRTSPFADVPTGHPFYTEIAWLAAEGISTGTVTSSGAWFKPGDAVSREAMAAFLYRAAGEPGFSVPSRSPFVDVATSHPFYRAIAWMRSAGISTGYSDGTFRPAVSIARDAMAAFLHRS